MIAALALAMAAGAAPNPFLAEAKALYSSLDFEKCIARLGQAATQWKSSGDELRDIELYGALCHFNLGHEREAAQRFRTALRIDEAADLPPYSPPRAVELFLKVKESLREKPAPFPDNDLPPDAPTNVTLTPRPKPDEVPIAAPFPWKQRAAPIALGIVALAAVATGIGLGLHAKNLEGQANAARFESDFVALGNAARANATGANIAWGVAGAAAIGSAVTWWLADRDERAQRVEGPVANKPRGDEAPRD